MCSNTLSRNMKEAGLAFEKKGKWADYFGNSNPIVVELGCGKGGIYGGIGTTVSPTAILSVSTSKAPVCGRVPRTRSRRG